MLIVKKNKKTIGSIKKNKIIIGIIINEIIDMHTSGMSLDVAFDQLRPYYYNEAAADAAAQADAEAAAAEAEADADAEAEAARGRYPL